MQSSKQVHDMDKIQEGEKHYTASVWILTKSTPPKMLLVHHKKFNKWMQPGGHIEWNENPVEAAVRETVEETGIDIGFLLEKIELVDEEGKFIPVPDFIMEQRIESHKDEPLHYHIDFEYVVKVDEQELKLSARESHNIGWFTKEEVLKLPVHEDTKVVVKNIM